MSSCPTCKGMFKESDRYCPNCGIDLETPIDQPDIPSTEGLIYILLKGSGKGTFSKIDSAHALGKLTTSTTT
jgi:hypothetical protein